MRKVTIIVLSLLLAAAIISGIIIYKQYSNSRNALMAAEKEVSALTGKVNQLNQDKAVLEDRIRDAAERFEALKKVESELETRDALAKDLRAQWAGALSQVAALRQEVTKGVKEIEGLRGRLLELEKENREKERSLGEVVERLQRSERESEGNRKTIAHLRDELSLKDGLITKLEGRLSELAGKEVQRFEALKKVESELETRDALVKDLRAQWAGALSQVATLRQEVTKGVEEVEGLRGRLSDLEKENREKEGSLVDLRQKVQRSERESEGNRKIIADLRNELSSKEGLITKLEGRLSELSGKEVQLKTELSELKTAHDTMISSLRGQIQNKEVTISELREKLSITFVDRVLFDSGSATITQEGRGILAKVGEILKGVKAKKIRVIGHTDDRPIAAEYHYKFPSNWELSSSRAASVVRFFQKEIGFLPEEMEAVGRSFYEPVASNETQEGRALNRRVNIIIAPRAE